MMATTRKQSATDTPPTNLAQTSPPVTAGMGLDAGFVWQQLASIQGTLGSIDTSLKHQASAVEKLEEKFSAKLSKLESDVAEFKQIRHTAKVVGWIIAGTASALIGIATYVGKTVLERALPATQQHVLEQSTPQSPAQQPVSIPQNEPAKRQQR